MDEPGGPRCRPSNLVLKLRYWNISCNILTDVCLGALSVPIIWGLNMSLRVRLYVIGILNLGYFAVAMGILKSAFMLTTAGDPDTTFDYWEHFWQNLQLNIGIIAACASCLKPLLGRLLKLNTTGASGLTYPKYGGSYHTPIGSKYTSGIGRTGTHDDFEAEYRSYVLETEREVSPSPPLATPRAAPVASAGSLPDYYKQYPETNSDNIQLLPMEPARGIVLIREYSVKYDN